MKVLYDRRDKDYYVLFEKNEIKKLFAEKFLHCLLYVRSSTSPRFIEPQRKSFSISVLENEKELHEKVLNLKNEEEVYFAHGDVILVYADYEHSEVKQSCTLFISKDFIEKELSQELFNRSGKNEKRYNLSGCKIHFFSEESNHFITSEMKIVFEMEANAWQRDHGSGGIF